ncbi:SOS response-associated peptidase family protein [Vibrio sp. H11]|uniref:SOS response-associated peptidase n=1 Tax=Vibrio sp. H11 TaxID=2565928 RepID=UPI0010A5B4F4|nr:SOS response-associated peptidase family protein [Vibrio sp. H11]
MCGRLNVIDDPLNRLVSEMFGIRFTARTNHDLRPTQTVATVAVSHGEVGQLDLIWGTQPYWAKSLVINAQAETVAVKATFAAAFEQHRVVVPCSGWYEWREEQGKKHKFHFASRHDDVLYMAGIALENGQRLVTLTTSANPECRDYHARMPLLIQPQAAMTWIAGHPEQFFALLTEVYAQPLAIRAE